MPYLPSLFDDPTLLNQFYDVVVSPHLKQAQTAAPDANKIKQVAAQLIQNLDLANNSVNVEQTGDPLYMKDLQSLDALISFLRLQKVNYSGHPIVNDQYSQMPPDEQSHYVPYKLNRAGIDDTGTGITVGIYKDGLIAYLQMLQQQANTSGNLQGRLANTMINRLISQANTDLKMGLKPQELGATDKDNTSVDALAYVPVIDTLNDTVVVENPLVPGREQGNIKIAPADLKSKLGFDDLMHKLKVSQGGKVIEYANFTNDTFCQVIRVLYARAYSYAFRRGTAVDKAYLQLVKDLAAMYNCSVEGSETAGGNNSVQPASYQSTTLSAPAKQALQSLIRVKLPLSGSMIDFNRINNWLQAYASLSTQLGSDPQTQSAFDPQTQSAISQAEELLNTIRTTYSMSTQSLADEALAVVNNISSRTHGTPAQKSAAPVGYLHALQQLISAIGNILTDFKSKVYDNLGGAADYQNELDEQIGSGGSSFYNLNFDKINSWLSDLPAAFQQLRTQGF